MSTETRTAQNPVELPVPVVIEDSTAFSWAEWGVAIGVMVFIGRELLNLYKKNESREDSRMDNYEMAARKREERLFEELVNVAHGNRAAIHSSNTELEQRINRSMQTHLESFEEHMRLLRRQVADIELIRKEVESLRTQIHQYECSTDINRIQFQKEKSSPF